MRNKKLVKKLEYLELYTMQKKIDKWSLLYWILTQMISINVTFKFKLHNKYKPNL
jgi:hypothetical protein